MNGKRIATELYFGTNSSNIIEDKYYSLEISASALPGANTVQVKANSRGNYLSSMSEAKEFVDQEISPGVSVEEGYHYYIKSDYDMSKNMKFGGTKSEGVISYYLKFMSDKYGNRFRFWFDKEIMGTDGDRSYSYQNALDDIIDYPAKYIYASESNVYLNGYTSKETILNIGEDYIKYM